MEMDLDNTNICCQGKGLKGKSDQVYFFSNTCLRLNWPAEIKKSLSIPHLITT
jgi:hypothetical protein